MLLVMVALPVPVAIDHRRTGRRAAVLAGRRGGAATCSGRASTRSSFAGLAAAVAVVVDEAVVATDRVMCRCGNATDGRRADIDRVGDRSRLSARYGVR